MKSQTFNTRSLSLIFTVLCGQVAAVGLARLALMQPVLAFGILYAIAFWVLAWKRPQIALMLIFASAPLQNDLGGGGLKFSLAEIHLGLVLPIVLLKCWTERRRLTLGSVAVPIALYLAVCLFSSIQTWRGSVALVSLVQMLIYMIIAVWVFSSLARDEDDFRPALNALVVVGVLLALAGVATNFSFLGLNKNGIGGSLACALLVCLELWFAAREARRKWLLGAALSIILAGLILTVSRGSWLGGFAGIVFICAMRRQFGTLLRAVVVLIPVAMVCWSLLPPKTQAYATGFEKSRYNIQARYESVDLARGYYEQNPLYGAGVGLRKTYDATNVEWLTLAETGVLGLFAFGLIHLVFVRTVWRSHHSFSRDDPRFSLLAIGGALMIYKLLHGSVDHYWSRGALTMTWAGVGMAVYACALARRQMTGAVEPPQTADALLYAPRVNAPGGNAPGGNVPGGNVPGGNVPAHEYS